MVGLGLEHAPRRLDRPVVDSPRAAPRRPSCSPAGTSHSGFSIALRSDHSARLGCPLQQRARDRRGSAPRVVAAGLEQLPQRLERLLEAPGGLKLPDLGDGIRGPAAGERERRAAAATTDRSRADSRDATSDSNASAWLRRIAPAGLCEPRRRRSRPAAPAAFATVRRAWRSESCSKRWPWLVAAAADRARLLSRPSSRSGSGDRDRRPLGSAEDIARLSERTDLNVLFILIDTLRADRLGSYGYERDTSPALDRLAARGVRFARHLAQSSWTKCSMASLWTGLYPARTGVTRFDARDPAGGAAAGGDPARGGLPDRGALSQRLGRSELRLRPGLRGLHAPARPPAAALGPPREPDRSKEVGTRRRRARRGDRVPAHPRPTSAGSSTCT